MKIKNPNKNSIYSTQGEYFKNLNSTSSEFKSKMKNGDFQHSPQESKYGGSKEAAKAKNIYN